MNILLTLLYIFLSYAFYSGYNIYKRINVNQLNGPTPLPIIGNFHQFVKSPYLKIREFHKVYGDIYRLWFGDHYIVIVREPELIKEMFVKNSQLFLNRPILPSLRFITSSYGLSTSRDENWVSVRDVVTKSIKKSQIKRIYDIVDIKVDELIQSMREFEQSGKPFNTALYAERFTVSLMFKYVFNEDVTYEDDILTGKVVEMSAPMDDIVKLLGNGQYGDYISAIAPFYYNWLKIKNKSVDKVKKFIRERFDEHVKTIDKDNPRDLLDLLINEYSNLDKESITHICGSCFDMFIAGNDTVTVNILWFVLRMQENYEIQDIAFNELKSITEKDPSRTSILLSDRPNTPYLNALIKESFRYNPVSPFGLPHVAEEDITIGNGKYFIPKGSQVLVNYKAMGLNEKYYKNPHVYDPTRFLGPIGPNQSFMSFGSGPRDCVGRFLALDEVYLVFSNILLNFKIKHAGVKVDDSEIFGLTLKPHKFNVFIESRNLNK